MRKRYTTYQYRPAPESYHYGNAEPSRVGQQDGVSCCHNIVNVHAAKGTGIPGGSIGSTDVVSAV